VAIVSNLITHHHLRGARIAYSVLRLRYGLEGSVFKSRWGASNFSLLKISKTALLFKGYRCSFLG